jgi:hypothetical protein
MNSCEGCVCVDDPRFPVEQIVYVPCLMKVIAPDKLVRYRRLGVKKVTKDEMKDVTSRTYRLDIAESESIILLVLEAVGITSCTGLKYSSSLI